jgi:uncharacterized protein YbdZ (MbtH family)
MSVHETDRVDTTIYNVVVNHEEQYSIWPASKEPPLGWREVGQSGLKSECLSYIKEAWTDIRPLSLRKKMEELKKNPPPPAPRAAVVPEESLVDRLCRGDHPIEVSLRAERSVKAFQEAIHRGYVLVKFTGTRGGTELGVRLDQDKLNFDAADFELGSGRVELQGGLILDQVKVNCKAKIDLQTLTGTGCLEKLPA